MTSGINRGRRQRGITFIGVLFLGAVLGFLAIVGARVTPTVTEYMSIVKAAKKAASDGTTVASVRASFDRTAAVDYIDSISGRDLEITKVDNDIVVRFAYDKEVPLFGPAFLLIKYRGSSAGGYD